MFGGAQDGTHIQPLLARPAADLVVRQRSPRGLRTDQAMAQQAPHRPALPRVPGSQAQQSRSDVPDGRPAQDPHDLGGGAAIIGHRKDVPHLDII